MQIQTANSPADKMVLKIMGRIKAQLKYYLFRLQQCTPLRQEVDKLNMCSGSSRIPGYLNLDISARADLPINLAKRNLPLPDSSIEVVVSMSAINYFTRDRARELINEIYRVLKPGGITRFGVQDLEKLAARYVQKDRDFFFQKLPDGTFRFEGPTLGDKFVAWLYGYESGGSTCRYFYDYESLAYLFREADFPMVEKKKYLQSRIADIELIDNRPGQMFFLEARK
ncbi:hypothetical protein D1AOALGA4SA_828 [Olavius algarvensis Delta 1 endosymbiont]|nr:hypothetical protein D1AOALGA4SA_828 [Olavius algarvensis Delta 1 endosymbiont]